MGMALAAVPDDGDLAGDEAEIAFAVDRGHELSFVTS